MINYKLTLFLKKISRLDDKNDNIIQNHKIFYLKKIVLFNVLAEKYFVKLLSKHLISSHVDKEISGINERHEEKVEGTSPPIVNGVLHEEKNQV